MLPTARRLRFPRRLAGAAALFATLAGLAAASALYRPEPEESFRAAGHGPWEAVERHRDPHPRYAAEPFHPDLPQLYPPVVEAFGTAEPHSSQFLLHRAPGWDTATEPTPVLLIHGANDDATRRYARPLATTDEAHATTPGLMQALAAAGRSVFGVTFSHYHGDNVAQGEQVANAITRIRRLLGRDDDPGFQVDLVTFSKGAMAARCYLEDAGPARGQTWMTAYRGDVRRVVFQCGPLGGVDTPFRYYLYNLSNFTAGTPAPLGASRLLVYGWPRSTGKGHILSGYWPGQVQMLYDQRKLGVPHGPLSFTADAGISQKILVDGGAGLAVSSEGIDAAAAAGGDLIEYLNERGLPPGVEAAALAGSSPVLYDERYPKWKIPAGMQIAAPNDGLLFTKSALYTEGLTARGARVLATATLRRNHIDLSRDAEAFAWVAAQLAAPAQAAAKKSATRSQ